MALRTCQGDTDREHVELDGGFVARRHYELTYTTSRCPVTGAGLAAVRDDDGNELAGIRLPHVSVPLDMHAGC